MTSGDSRGVSFGIDDGVVLVRGLAGCRDHM
jgi:hypothetical protein